ncbi:MULTISPECIES: DUF4148 domain-containing protein [Paraburkholderia]|uniref:DUF4148 domain-containing protein n=1 Tax=Paraburkholderia TaxID=1822464 RepID=UPI00036B0617|nr:MULTISPECIES: DUF4148 domain-containing protein [Paraburkholderia]MDH6153382.1 hypothetical protein [Paraburkholderia sp. WSM4179]
MKSLIQAVVVVAALVAPVVSFAQSDAPVRVSANGTTQSALNTARVSANGTTQSASNTAKTRAQVYQELVHAEKDGQIASLNSTIYAGG